MMTMTEAELKGGAILALMPGRIGSMELGRVYRKLQLLSAIAKGSRMAFLVMFLADGRRVVV